MAKVARVTTKQKIAICWSEAGELQFQAKNHRAYAQNGAKNQEEKEWHLAAALYKEAQARGYINLAAKFETKKIKNTLQGVAKKQEHGSNNSADG